MGLGWLKELFALLRTPPALLWELLATIVLVCTVLLFLPQCALEWLGFSQFEEKVRPIVAIVEIGVLSFLAVAGVAATWQCGARARKVTKGKKALKERLDSLTPDEQYILSQYINQQLHTVYWGQDSSHRGTVLQLGLEKILKPTEPADPAEFFTIKPSVWDYLQKCPELVDAKIAIARRARRAATDKPEVGGGE